MGTFRVGGSKIRKTCSILESNSAFESSQIVWCNRKKHSAKVYGNQRKLEWSQTRIATLFFKRKSPFFPKKISVPTISPFFLNNDLKALGDTLYGLHASTFEIGLKCLVCTLDRREEIFYLSIEERML